jgi:hypothetical protein
MYFMYFTGEIHPIPKLILCHSLTSTALWFLQYGGPTPRDKEGESLFLQKESYPQDVFVVM